MGSKRVDVKAILADADLRRKLMVSTIQATQAREGIDTTHDQADRAYQVVSEGERGSFFALECFKGGKRGEQDRRHEMFVKSLRAEADRIRYDVARRDFGAIDGHPLAYERVAIVVPMFRESPPLSPAWAATVQGLATARDERFVRYFWEVQSVRVGQGKEWIPFAKGGEYCRFYSDVSLVVLWTQNSIAAMGKDGRVQNVASYFKSGLTWPRRTQRGFNVRVLPSGCIFADKGPAILPVRTDDHFFLLGVANSLLLEYILQGLTSFGSWEVGAVQKLPIPRPAFNVHESIGLRARSIYELKKKWDLGNEASSAFTKPWLLLVAPTVPIATMLDGIVEQEASDERRLRNEYADLNREVYQLYAVSDATRAQVEHTLGNRPPEVLWPQMEGKSGDQKRMEHVWRLLSFAVKRVLETDDDGIVPFSAANGEDRLVDRVRHELAGLVPGRDASQFEVEIVNELKRTARGYRRCQSLDEWLESTFFEYHCGLYKSRPIFWHIASTQGTASFAFGVLVHYHRFDKNRMAKLRSTYLRDAIEGFRREAALADKAGHADDRLEWQAKVEEAQALDKKLQLIQEGYHEGSEGGDRDYRILTPWKKPGDRPKAWDPDLDDGVKVNIEPFEKAGVLRVGKVT